MTQAILDAFPRTSQVKIMRRRVLQHDLDMFAALSGRTPRTPLPTEPIETAVRVPTAARAKAWSSTVLGGYLTQIPVTRFAAKAVSPEVSEWMKKMSSQAMGRLQEAQVRLTAARDGARGRA
ncbi:MAG TPA: hypothetical protein VIM11_09045 [Tepidisphaeraceae bacterium]|jgi:hypothetical protein